MLSKIALALIASTVSAAESWGRPRGYGGYHGQRGLRRGFNGYGDHVNAYGSDNQHYGHQGGFSHRGHGRFGGHAARRHGGHGSGYGHRSHGHGVRSHSYGTRHGGFGASHGGKRHGSFGTYGRRSHGHGHVQQHGYGKKQHVAHKPVRKQTLGQKHGHCGSCGITGHRIQSSEGILRNAFALSGAGSYDGRAHGGILGSHRGHKFDGFGKSYGGKKGSFGGFGHAGIAKRRSFKTKHSGFNDNAGVFTSGFGAGRYGRPSSKTRKYGGPISGKPQANLSFNRSSSKKSNPYGSLGGW